MYAYEAKSVLCVVCCLAGRFNERLVLSLASCPHCLLMDDELNVLPTSSLIRHIAPLPTGDHEEGPAAAVGEGCLLCFKARESMCNSCCIWMIAILVQDDVCSGMYLNGLRWLCLQHVLQTFVLIMPLPLGAMSSIAAVASFPCCWQALMASC